MATPPDEAPPPPDGNPPPPPPDGLHNGHHPQPFFVYPYCYTCQQEITKKEEPPAQNPTPEVNWIYIGIAVIIGGLIGYVIGNR